MSFCRISVMSVMPIDSVIYLIALISWSCSTLSKALARSPRYNAKDFFAFCSLSMMHKMCRNAIAVLRPLQYAYSIGVRTLLILFAKLWLGMDVNALTMGSMSIMHL